MPQPFGDNIASKKNNGTMKEEVARVNTFSNALMIVTSIHHIYGAIVYDTPWRLHVLFVSIPVIFLSIMTRWML